MGHINAVRLQSQTVPIVPLVQSVLQCLDDGRVVVNCLPHHTFSQSLAVEVVLGHSEGSLEAAGHEGFELVVAVLVGPMVRMVVTVVLAAHVRRGQRCEVGGQGRGRREQLRWRLGYVHVAAVFSNASFSAWLQKMFVFSRVLALARWWVY